MVRTEPLVFMELERGRDVEEGKNCEPEPRCQTYRLVEVGWNAMSPGMVSPTIKPCHEGVMQRGSTIGRGRLEVVSITPEIWSRVDPLTSYAG